MILARRAGTEARRGLWPRDAAPSDLPEGAAEGAQAPSEITLGAGLIFTGGTLAASISSGNFNDNSFTIFNNADNTKIATFSAGTIA